MKLLWLVSAGERTGDARRVAQLQASVDHEARTVFAKRNGRSAFEVARLLRIMRGEWHDACVIEGTGLRVGIAAIAASGVFGTRYVVSSGDAVGQFFRNRYGRLLGYAGYLYERLLYKHSIGFIGWTPYLTGRAIALGAPSGVTVEGLVPDSLSGADPDGAAVRRALAIEPSALVVGVSGSVNWSPRQAYCYGLELVNAAKTIKRHDVCFLIVGDGSGIERLKHRAAGDPRFRFTGRIQHAEMGAHIAAMDVAVIAQTPDELGLLRLTTKLPEYLACGVPILMSASPGLFDYLLSGTTSAAFPLPRLHPASRQFGESLAAAINRLDTETLRGLRATIQKTYVERFKISTVGPRLNAYLQSLEK